MLLNTKCERCNEPTKHVVGFWDGENGKSGFVHDCENEKCEVRQLIKVTETKAMQERFRIQNLNSRKRMYAGYIAALRKDAKISMMEMSKILYKSNMVWLIVWIKFFLLASKSSL